MRAQSRHRIRGFYRQSLLAGCAAILAGSPVLAQTASTNPVDYEPVFQVNEVTLQISITWVPPSESQAFGQCYRRSDILRPGSSTVLVPGRYRQTDAVDCGRNDAGEFEVGLSRYDSESDRGNRGGGSSKPDSGCDGPGRCVSTPWSRPGGAVKPGHVHPENPDSEVAIIGRDDVAPDQLLDTENQFSNVVFIVTQGPGGAVSTCTGTLINRRQILTAAHCFPDPDSQIVRVSFDPEGQTAIFDAMSVTLHDDFSFQHGRSDVAIITLDTAALIAPPVQLDDATGTHAVVGSELTVVGCGVNGNGAVGATGSDSLRRYGTNILEHAGPLSAAGFPRGGSYGGVVLDVDQPYLVMDFDSPAWPSSFNITGGEVSTGPGDSGGPAFVTTDNGLVQVGITSFSLHMSAPTGTYGTIVLFQPVSEHIDWISGLDPFVQASALAGNGD